jgi:hypothetical protein
MTRYVLTVTTPKPSIFEAYWYGVGEILDYDANTGTWTVDYGSDRYRAQYQADRFWSGLYPASVEAV